MYREIKQKIKQKKSNKKGKTSVVATRHVQLKTD